MEKSKSADTRKALSLALLSTVASAVPTGQAAVQHSGSCIVSRRFSTTEAAESMRPETFELSACVQHCTKLKHVCLQELNYMQKVFAYKCTSAFNIAPRTTLHKRAKQLPAGVNFHQITIQLFASMQLF